MTARPTIGARYWRSPISPAAIGRSGRNAATALSEAGFDDAESRREMLLADLKAIFDGRLREARNPSKGRRLSSPKT